MPAPCGDPTPILLPLAFPGKHRLSNEARGTCLRPPPILSLLGAKVVLDTSKETGGACPKHMRMLDTSGKSSRRIRSLNGSQHIRHSIKPEGRQEVRVGYDEQARVKDGPEGLRGKRGEFRAEKPFDILRSLGFGTRKEGAQLISKAIRDRGSGAGYMLAKARPAGSGHCGGQDENRRRSTTERRDDQLFAPCPDPAPPQATSKAQPLRLLLRHTPLTRAVLGVPRSTKERLLTAMAYPRSDASRIAPERASASAKRAARCIKRALFPCDAQRRRASREPLGLALTPRRTNKTASRATLRRPDRSARPPPAYEHSHDRSFERGSELVLHSRISHTKSSAVAEKSLTCAGPEGQGARCPSPNATLDVARRNYDRALCRSLTMTTTIVVCSAPGARAIKLRQGGHTSSINFFMRSSSACAYSISNILEMSCHAALSAGRNSMRLSPYSAIARSRHATTSKGGIVLSITMTRRKEGASDSGLAHTIVFTPSMLAPRMRSFSPDVKLS